MTKKKYILKPGIHQFAPNSPAIYHNDNLSDEESQWYLNKYPHIAVLFEKLPNNEIALAVNGGSSEISTTQSEPKQYTAKSQNNEDLSTTN
ncbi:MAG TPA: hypothetical protein VGC01_11760 [Mucilaginibacter sp.]